MHVIYIKLAFTEMETLQVSVFFNISIWLCPGFMYVPPSMLGYVQSAWSIAFPFLRLYMFSRTLYLVSSQYIGYIYMNPINMFDVHQKMKRGSIKFLYIWVKRTCTCLIGVCKVENCFLSPWNSHACMHALNQQTHIFKTDLCREMISAKKWFDSSSFSEVAENIHDPWIKPQHRQGRLLNEPASAHCLDHIDQKCQPQALVPGWSDGAGLMQINSRHLLFLLEQTKTSDHHRHQIEQIAKNKTML